MWAVFFAARMAQAAESSCEVPQQFGMLLLEMPEIYHFARKHLTFFGGGKMVVTYRKEKADAEGNIADIGRNCEYTQREKQEGNGMEIQRNKTLNRLFIVLAVLVIALQIYQLLDIFIYNGVTNYFVDSLLKTVCVVLPILAITFRKHKAASVILSVVYLIISIAYMDWSSLSYLISGIIRYGIDVYDVIWLGEIIIKFAIGIFTLLNAVGKVQTKKVIAIVCFILVIIRIITGIISRRYFYGWYEYLMLFPIGMGILRDVPPEMFKKKQVQEGDHTMSSKSKQTAMLFSIFTGVLGVDRFYLGYTALGIFKLLTVGGAGIWALIDLIRISVDSLRPADGSPWVEETRDENIRSIAANMQAIAERLEKLQAQNVPAEAEKPQTDGENQETHKVSLKK